MMSLGVPDFSMSAAPMDALQMQPQQVPNLPIKAGGLGGMFGGNGKMFLLAALAGLMQRKNPNAANSIMSAMMLKQRQAMEDQQFNQRRQQQLDDQKAMYDYKLAHPEPTSNDTVNDYNFWKQTLSPQDFQTWLKNKIDPPQLMQVPGVGIVSVPRAAPQAAPTAPVGKLTPLGAGGQSPTGSGNFPY